MDERLLLMELRRLAADSLTRTYRYRVSLSWPGGEVEGPLSDMLATLAELPDGAGADAVREHLRRKAGF